MRKQGLLSLSVNLFLLAFFFTTLPLPRGLLSVIGISPLQESSIGARTLQAGGNMDRGNIVVSFPDSRRYAPGGTTDSHPEETCKIIGWDIVFERYPVYGDTLEELQRGVTDFENGIGPLEPKEGKRYAAYVTANYKIDYQAQFIGRIDSDGEVAIELGARADVRPEMHIILPDFKPSNPSLQADCDAEEARLLEHENGHVEVYRMCGERLEDSLKELRVVGHGATPRLALASAQRELDNSVMKNLEQTVSAANEMNGMMDFLTNHGLGLG